MADKKSMSFSELRDYIDVRIENLEDLIKISMVTSLSNQLGEILASGEFNDKEMMTWLNSVGFCLVKTETYGDNFLIYIRKDEKLGIKEIREIVNTFRNKWNLCIPVFIIEKATIPQQKKYLEEKISFVLGDKEIHIMR